MRTDHVNNLQTNFTNLQKVNVKNLSDGQNVRVVVSQKTGNGKYEGFVAGVKVSFSSAKPLKPGSTFVATVSTANGKIILIPENNTVNDAMSVIGEVNTEEIALLLEGFGLNNDELSKVIVQQFKQLGLSLNSSELKRIYNLALKFKGKEKNAAKLISILKSKGISADEKQILELINQLLLSGEDENSEFKNDFLENSFEENFFTENLIKGIKSLFCFENENNQFENVKIKTDKTGLLTLSNHLKNNEGFSNWIFVPFEIIRNNESEEIIGEGIIKLLINQKIKDFYFSFNTGEEKYNFNFEYENQKIKKINAAFKNLDSQKYKALTDKLINHFGKEIFSIIDFNETSLTDCEKEIFYKVGGKI